MDQIRSRSTDDGLPGSSKWTSEDLLNHFTDLHSQIGLLLSVSSPTPADGEPVTRHQVSALRTLAEGPATMREFAKGLNLSSGSATSLADRLVRAGLARRALDPSDRRIVQLEMTTRGRESMEAYFARQREVIQALEQRFEGERLVPVSDCAVELLSLLAQEVEAEAEGDQ